MTHKERGMTLVQTVAPHLQLLCLLMVGVLECVLFSIGNLHEYFFYDLLHNTILIPCIFFWIVTILQTSGRLPRYGIGFAVAMVVWFFAVELQHRVNSMEPHTIGLFLSVYLLAFPFAAVTKDSERQLGIKWMTFFFTGASAVLLLYAVLLMTGKLLGFLQGCIFWDGARLRLAMHPNITSRVFLVTIAFCMCSAQYVRKKWLKVAILLPVIPLFAAMALTNSRGVLVMTCATIAGTIFFLIYKGGWKRFFAGAVVAAMVFAALFVASREIFAVNSNYLIEKKLSQQTVSEEINAQEAQAILTDENSASAPDSEALSTEEMAVQNLGGESVQRSFLQDLWSLNSRTMIWGSVFQGIRQNPAILLWGTDDTSTLSVADHTHNAWLETLVRLGLPGFIFSMVFTVQAVWSAICLMWYPHVGLEKKIISMLAISLLVSGMLEPFLFFTEDFAHFMDIIFFLCLGYMVQWRKQLHGDVPQKTERSSEA